MTDVLLPREMLRVLDAVSAGPYPLTALFEPQRVFKRIFGRAWHGLGPDACLSALGRLADFGLVELEWDTPGGPPNDRELYVALTPAGGECWAQAYAVDWSRLIFEIAESVPEDAADRMLVRFASVDLLNEWKLRLSSSACAGNYRFEDTKRLESWPWSNWKTLSRAAEVAVDIVRVDGRYHAALELMVGCSAEMRRGFRADDAPAEFSWIPPVGLVDR